MLCSQVFKIKLNVDSLVNKYETRHVLKGYAQVFGMDFF